MRLPVELLDIICTALVYPDGKKEFSIPWVFRMMPLRLVCRDQFEDLRVFRKVVLQVSMRGPELRGLSEAERDR